MRLLLIRKGVYYVKSEGKVLNGTPALHKAYYCSEFNFKYQEIKRSSILGDEMKVHNLIYYVQETSLV